MFRLEARHWPVTTRIIFIRRVRTGHQCGTRDVLGMVNDILWLHYPHFYLTDGTPVEGLSYSYLSIEDTADLVVRSSTIPNPQALLPSLTCT